MRDYTVYVCEKCGLEFPDDHEKCQAHEDGHIKPDPYQLWKNGSYLPDSKYPVFIRIPMADGAEAMYKFDAITKEAEQEESPLLPAEDLPIDLTF